MLIILVHYSEENNYLKFKYEAPCVFSLSSISSRDVFRYLSNIHKGAFCEIS